MNEKMNSNYLEGCCSERVHFRGPVFRLATQGLGGEVGTEVERTWLQQRLDLGDDRALRLMLAITAITRDSGGSSPVALPV